MASSILLMLLGAATYWYGRQQGVLLGQIAAVVLTMSSLWGLWRGGVRKAAMLAAFVGVTWAAATWPDFADPVVKMVSGSANGVANSIITAAAAIVVLLSVHFLARRFRRRLVMPRPVLLALDRLTGAGIGCAEGLLVMLSLCWVTVAIQPHAMVMRDHPQTLPDSFRHDVAVTVLRLADEASAEPLGDVVAATNMIEKTPALRQAFEQLNSSGEFRLDTIDPRLAAKAHELLEAMTDGEVKDFKELIERSRR